MHANGSLLDRIDGPENLAGLSYSDAEQQGMMASLNRIPAELMVELRATAAAAQDWPVNRRAAAVIVVIWILAVLATGWLVVRWFSR